MANQNDNITGGQIGAEDPNLGSVVRNIPDQTVGDQTIQPIVDLTDTDQFQAVGSGQVSDQPQETFTTGSLTGAPGNLRRSDIFPGIDDPILKGTSTSQTLGTQPIFVGSGGFAPLGILDKQNAAYDEARRKRMERKASVKLGDSPSLKDTRFQKQLDSAFIENQQQFINKAKQLHGDNWDLALQGNTDVGRQFRQSLQEFQTVKRGADEFYDKAIAIEDQIEQGQLVISDKTNQLFEDYKQMKGDFQGGNPLALMNKVKQVESSIQVDGWLNKNVLPKLQAEIRQFVSANKDRGDFNQIYRTKITSIEKQADAIAKRLKSRGGAFQRNDLISEKDISDAIKQRIGRRVEQTSKEISKPKDSGKEPTQNQIDIRDTKIRTLQQAFGADGKAKTAGAKAKTILGDLIGGKYQGGVVRKAKFVKAGEGDPSEMNKTISTITGAFGPEADELTPDAQAIQSSLVGKEFNGEEINSVEFVKQSSTAGDQNSVKIVTQSTDDQGNVIDKTTEIPLDAKSGETLNKGFGDQFKRASNRIVFTIGEGKADGEVVEVEKELDLTSPASYTELNSVFNTSQSEKTNVPNPFLQTKQGTDQQAAQPAQQFNANTESRRKTKDGRIAIFDKNTKQFLRWE